MRTPAALLLVSALCTPVTASDGAITMSFAERQAIISSFGAMQEQIEALKARLAKGECV